MRFSLATLAAALAVSCHGAPTANGPTFEATTCLDEQLINTMDANNLPGASLAVLRHGEMAYVQAYGTLHAPGVGDSEEDDDPPPVLLSTPFRMMSISKVLTATTVVLLAQHGLLDLDELVFAAGGVLHSFVTSDVATQRTKSASFIDPRLFNITTRQLLRHSAGFTPLLDPNDPLSDPAQSSLRISEELGIPGPMTCDNLIQFMVNVPLLYVPGTTAEYSNVGYCVLELIVRKTTGLSFEEAVRKWLLDPLDVNPEEFYLVDSIRLEDTSPLEPEYYMQGEGICHGPSVYPIDHGKNVTCPYGASFNGEAAAGFGGWVASARELIKVAKVAGSSSTCRQHNVADSFCLLLEDTWRNEIEERSDYWPSELPWYVGLGWMFSGDDGARTWFHEGSNSGSLAHLIAKPDGSSYAILFNGNNETGIVNYDTMESVYDGIAKCVEDDDWPVDFYTSEPNKSGSSSFLMTIMAGWMAATIIGMSLLML